MSEITKVTTDTVIQKASSILSEAAAFKEAFDAMYDTIHELKQTFTSTDGEAYIDKIDSYQSDFAGMYSRLVSAANGIRTIAENYDATVRKNTVK